MDKYIGKRLVRSYIGITPYKTRLMAFHTPYHSRLTFNRLRYENKRYTAFLCKRYRKIISRNRLHHSRCERYIHTELRLFTLFKFCNWRLKTDIFYSAFL